MSLRRVVTFRYYREINQELLSQVVNQMDTMKQAAKTASEKTISADTSITSRKRALSTSTSYLSSGTGKFCGGLPSDCQLLRVSLCGILLLMTLLPGIKPDINQMVMTWLPYFSFILYLINRGTGFTKALFMNCDHSLLTYSFYKQPGFILKLFQIRLREIIKINAVPALVIGAGLCLTLYVSGGTDNPLDYVVLLVTILSMSVFFSIHYLTLYYLLQPYTAGTEIKSGTYRIVMTATYADSDFGILTMVFFVLYGIVASILVFRFAPKTFKIRN